MGEIIVSPLYGLANKLRIIASSKIVANHLMFDHYITDFIETDSKPGFDSVFEINDYHKIKMVTQFYPIQDPPNGIFDLEYYRHLNSIHIRSCGIMRIKDMDSTQFMNELQNEYKKFKLLPKYRDQILQLPKNTIGLHIRRSDNKNAIEASPTNKFIEIIQQNKNTPIFLSTDDINLEQQLKHQYSNIICTLKRYKHTNTVIRPDIRTIEDQNVSQDQLKGALIEAVIDAYTLSQCPIIYGSYWSSFSVLASMLNNSKLIIVKK